eukprot:scaffold60934_cov76-Cyclotella_meneghiniana.AAC.2
MSSDNSAAYKPSPYTSILPRVQLSKTKPLIQVVDVLPCPADHVDEKSSRKGGDCSQPQHTLNAEESSKSAPTAPSQVKVDGDLHSDTATNFVTVINSGTTSNEEHDTAADNQSTENIICSTCTKNIARYTCPKCSASYCSVECYKVHDGTLDSEGEKICTESFYKNRVLGEYHSRGSDEDRVTIRGILNRMHQDVSMQMDDQEWRENSLSQLLHTKENAGFNRDVMTGLNEYNQKLEAAQFDDAANEISDDDLAELASYILNLDEEEDQDDDPTTRVQKIKEMLPPHLLYAFDCALASALGLDSVDEEQDGLNLAEERNKQQINEKWRPWWLPEIDQTLDSDDVVILSPNLDERILSIPHLSTLVSGANNHNLAYNVLDVLFATSFALRTTSATAENDAAELLLSQSLVLSNNSKYENVPGALSSSAERFVEINKTIHLNNKLSWNELALDAALISKNRRYVLRSLFEAVDLLQSGVELIKIRDKEIKVKDKSTYLRMKKDLDGVKRQYKLAMKKIEYFQSWCSSMWTDGVGSEITKEIESFVDNWRMPELAEIESQKIETMIGNMLKKDEDDENDLSIVESTRNNYPFRMGCELVAVSTVNKNDGSLVTTINNLTEASKF